MCSNHSLLLITDCGSRQTAAPKHTLRGLCFLQNISVLSCGNADRFAVRRADDGCRCVGHIGNRPFADGAAVKCAGRIPSRGKGSFAIGNAIAVNDRSAFAGLHSDPITLLRFQSGDCQRFLSLRRDGELRGDPSMTDRLISLTP